MSISFTWPASSGSSCSLTAVDFPVFIGSEETAIQLLGGEKRVSEWIQKEESTVGLFLRPGDPMSHEVKGKRMETNNFLIRVPRPRLPSSSSSSSSSSSEVLIPELVPPTFEGVISKTYVFDGMADFSFLPTGIPVSIDGKFVKSFLDGMESIEGSTVSSSTEPVVGSLSAAESHWRHLSQNEGNSSSMIPRIVANAQDSAVASSSFSWVERLNRHLNLSPVNFSNTDVPKEYTYTGASVEQTSQVVEKRLVHRESFSLKRAYYDFENDKPVPSEPLLVSQALFNTDYSLEEIIRKLKDAFMLRPVWTLSSLGIYLLMDMRIFRMQLPAVAYFVRGGCFRNMWIRLGFDPRLDSSSRLFLMAECRIPVHIWKLIPEGDTQSQPQTADSKTAPSKSEKTPITLKTTKGVSAMKGSRASSSSKSKSVAWAAANQGTDVSNVNEENEVSNKNEEKKEDIDGDVRVSGSGSENEGALDEEIAAGSLELSVPVEGAPWPWTFWCGGPLLRRQGVQIIDLLWSPLGVSHFFKAAGFDHGVGFIPAESTLAKIPTVAIGPRGIVMPISEESLVEALLYLPTTAVFSKNNGWLTQNVTDQIRRQVARDVFEYISTNSPLTLKISSGGEGGGGGGSGSASKGRRRSQNKKRARREEEEEE